MAFNVLIFLPRTVSFVPLRSKLDKYQSTAYIGTDKFTQDAKSKAFFFY